MPTRAELAEMSRSPESHLRARAARARRTPGEDLVRLLSDPVPYVRLSALRNASLPAEHLRAQVDQCIATGTVRQDLAGNPALTEDMMRDLDRAGLMTPHMYRHRSCPVDLLRDAARSPKAWERAVAAGHPRLPEDLWDTMVTDPHPTVRASAAGNKAIPDERIQALADDPRLDIVRKVAARARGPVKETALANLRRRSRAKASRYLLATHTSDADLLDELALDEVSWVRRRAAANPQARDEAKVAAALLG